MPFEDVLKINPKLDNKDLEKMQRALQSRFSKIAKGFGKGLVNAIKSGGVLGLAMGLIDKLLNPLKEVQESIDRTLKTSDDLATNAKQFNTQTGKLAKLVTLAKASGLEDQDLYTLMVKYQGAVAGYNENPNDPANSSVKEFAGITDIADGFFSFIQSLNDLKDTNKQIMIQSQVFGEKQVLKMADFLRGDFNKLRAVTGIDKISTDKATKSIDGTADLADLADALRAKSEFKDLVKKGSLITENIIKSKAQLEELEKQKENKRLASYDNLLAISQASEKMIMVLEEGMTLLGSLVKKILPFIDKATEAINKFTKSPMMRGVKGLFGGGD